MQTSLPIVSVFGEPSLHVVDTGVFTAAAFQEDGAVRVDVVRNDLSDGVSWDELMEIKNLMGFGDQDAIELYPADDSVINTGNVRHLFIMPENHPLVKRLN